MAGWWIAILAGPFAGSTISVLVRRMPRESPQLWGRSACEHCGHVLRPWEMVPLLSYAVQRGRCTRCGGRIAPAHLAAELAATAIAAVPVALGFEGVDLALACALGWVLLTLAWLDWDHFWLPDTLTLPLLLAGLAAAWWLAPWDITDRALGAIAGYAGLQALNRAYRALRHRDGLGAGDAKLLAATGAWLGWQALPGVLLAAALIGLGIAGVQRLRGTALTAATALPFGPALAAAFWALFLVQNWPD